MSPIHSILHQSALHLITYALVGSVLFASVWHAFTVRLLRRKLRLEGEKLRDGAELDASMLHPIAKTQLRLSRATVIPDLAIWQRAVEHHEAVLFLPLKAKITLTRDLSTLMGLVATCTALVTAGADFARHGRAELLVGSVASGTISTCIAAIGCMISLANAATLLRLRVRVASEIEDWLLNPLPAFVAASSSPAVPPAATSPLPEEVFTDAT